MVFVVPQNVLGARLRGRTATQRSKKGSQKVLGKGSQKGSEKAQRFFKIQDRPPGLKFFNRD